MIQSMPAAKPNVFNIPASAPFLPALIDALREGKLVPGFPASGDPLELTRATIYLPTRRACRIARETFLKQIGDAAILPRIVAIGDLDEDEIAFAHSATGELAEIALALPEALEGLERMMPLAALILKWAQTIAPRARGETPLVANSPANAFALAQDLARLMDDMTTRQVGWDRLDELVTDEFDKYWELTLNFLKFIRENWPAILDEKGHIEPATRRDKLIEAEVTRLASSIAPLIAAGFTGSIPATATLLETIAKLPHGAVVLPGLDTDLDNTTWAMIGGDSDAAHGHPQFAMAALLRRIGISRADVESLAPPRGRERIVSEALRPAAASERWKDLPANAAFAAHADAAMSKVAVIEAANAEEEALAIAVALRETVDNAAKTAALVTPDVGLGRRVMALLARWNVPAEDSRGVSLADRPDGVFARLTIEAALEGLAPLPLLALIKHSSGAFAASGVATLERAILRGPRPKRGTAGLENALKTLRGEITKARAKVESALHRSDPRLQLTDGELDAVAALIARLKTAFAPLENLPPGAQPIAKMARRHAETVAALGAMTTELDDAFGTIERVGTLDVTASDYAELFHDAIAERKIYRPPGDARVHVFGPLEARLQHVDRLVLGGLIEGVWPPETRGDPWLSRPMRHELGLNLPERRIGLSAHDFAQALGAPDVILSRAAKLAGAPTVASRFVQRLAAVAGEARWVLALERGARYIALARRLDEAEAPTPVSRPAPKPPFEARPRQLSVTEVEDLLRDPYTIYARHVLDLAPLDDIDTPPGAADRGTVIHDSLAEFGKTFPKQPPADPVQALTDIGERHFNPLSDFPEVRAFWWPRFLRIAQWFARFDAQRRAGLKSFGVEIGGRIEIPFGKESFTLTVRADRIECLANGRYAILDYKTGAPPTEPQVRTGLSPQLTLEAAILRQGGFKDIPAGGSVEQLLYVRLRGGAEPGEELPIAFKEGTPDQHADAALAELTKVLEQFSDPAKPYYSLLHPMWTTHYGTYDHLARVKEWSLTSGASEDGGDE
jgi:ATP-dependent helicase/nuclease subunit B